MSDRLNLWPERAGWAEVNLADHPDMESAIRAFANWAQVLKVFGPSQRIKECWEAWAALSKADPDVTPPDAVTFVEQEAFHA